jgi:hypothetical protein
MTTTRWKLSPAAIRVVLIMICGTIPLNEGCVSRIAAYRAAADGSETRNRVAIPLFPSRNVDLYWGDIAVFSPPKPRMPDREHVAVGHVTVNTDWLWGYPAVPAIEWSLRRGATGLGADAVLVEECFASGPCMEVYGLAVKWKTAPGATRPSGKDD